MILIPRNTATQATIDRFVNQPFVWGVADCAQLVAFHLQQLGHPDPLKKVTGYSTRRTALRAMRKAGIKDMASQLEALGFVPIAPAAALPGDIIGIQTEETDAAAGWISLGVNIGADRILGFAPAPEGREVCSWAPVSVCTHAWRVNPVEQVIT